MRVTYGLHLIMEFTLEHEVSLVDSLFYLAYTPIPVRLKYGDNHVLYNHKSGQIAPIDTKGYSTIESGGVYTSEHIDSPIIQAKPTSPVFSVHCRSVEPLSPTTSLS
jgi:hypothetical protein